MTSVNTPLTKTAPKGDQQSNGTAGRKGSISVATTPGGYGLPSPSLARGGGRRRETSESYPFPANNVSSPGGFGRDESRAQSPPPSLLRRRTDIKPDDGEEKSAPASSGSVKRQQTGPVSAGFAGPASPWSTGPQSAALSPMGSFGNFGLSSGAGGMPNDKRSVPGNGRPESRFKGVLGKDAGDDAGQRTVERQVSMSGLSRVNQNESWRPKDRQDPGNTTLDETEEGIPAGSAALSAGADVSPLQGRQGYRGFGTPSRQGAQDEFGFGAFGMTSEGTQGFGQARDSFQQTPAHQRTGQPAGHEQMNSPTGTNPYQSPDQHGVDHMTEDANNDGSDTQSAHLPGLGGLSGLGALPNLGRAPGGLGGPGDRSQTSSVGPTRGFPNFGGLGQLGGVGPSGWPVSQGGLGTPSRQASGINAFGSGIFSNNMSDLQSPGLPGLGGSIMSPQGGPFGGRGMTSMFSSAMQDQMHPQLRGHESHPDDVRDVGSERAGAHAFSGLGDMRGGIDTPFGNAGSLDGRQDVGDAHFGAPGQSQDHIHPAGSSASNQPPAPQQRTMVMPDRMRWIYRDPQGQTQGPWSGLEMHDWYKAGFFSPELLVKKYEDPDYEPLAQLIRRIGNSREPFLVPQIGIPHGAPSVPAGGASAWAGPGPAPGSAPAAGGAQPPFASSFPSFGTTLTADQQNALERRKQEEQYLMARQKEHLAQAQIAQRMGLQGGHPALAGQLHHHASAHSLQSQPSFGSIASPTAYQPSPIQGPAAGGQSGQHSQGFFDNSFRATQASGLSAVGAGADSLGNIREEEIPGIMDRLNLGGNRAAPGQFGAPGQPFGSQQHSQPLSQDEHDKHVQQMLQDRAKLQQEQAQHDARQAEDDRPVSNERLQQLQQLQPQAQIDARLQQAQQKAMAAEQQRIHEIAAEQTSAVAQAQQSREPLSLTEQVQKAASAKHSPAPEQPGLPQPFPPAPSQSPLPAPAAQRTGRQSVADQLQTDSRDLSQTPSVDTPSVAVAPWAKEPTEAPKGPSLREIQEAEAKKAAEAEEMAAAARRAAFQREMEAQAQVVAPQPGLPTSSTWGAGSPATPTGGTPAAWAKTAQKPAGPTASKTLAQIQKEEEARKRKMVAAAAAQAQAGLMSAVPAPAGGKSYANLAGKITIPQAGPMGPGSPWTTVGASGKVKTPAPTVSSPAGNRAVSAGIPPALAPAASAPRKAPVSRTVSMANPATVNAQDEFRKWAQDTLKGDLKKGINGTFALDEPSYYPVLTHLHSRGVLWRLVCALRRARFHNRGRPRCLEHDRLQALCRGIHSSQEDGG